jgi:hypothetical protein
MGWKGEMFMVEAGFREYWVCHWRLINPRVEPQRFEPTGGEVIVDVHQVVSDLRVDHL